MINGSFEQGWETLYNKNQQPNGWTLVESLTGSRLLAPKAGNGDTESYTLCTPECVHKLDWQLPADEQLGQPKALILEGKAVYKIFGHAAFRATLAQQWTVTPGAVCSLTIPVQVHGQKKPDGTLYNADTGAAYWRVTINGTVGDWFTYNNDFSDREWMTYSPGFKALYGTVDLLIEFESHTLAGIDFFIDNVQFNSEAQPQPVECRGTPRVQYERVYNLLPQGATVEQLLDVAEKAYPERQTIGFSADDAGIGDLNVRRVDVWWFTPTDWDKDELNEFYAQYYPGVSVVHYNDFTGGDPPLPPVEPPTGNAPQPIVHYSSNFVGFQSYIPKAGWLDYIKVAKPTVCKFFSCGDVIRAKQAQPQMLSVWRKHVDNDGGWLVGDRVANARHLISLYEAELATTYNNMGISRAEAIGYIDVIESLNETIPSNNAAHIKAAVEFDVSFSQFTKTLFGDGAVKAGILNTAVGNPFAVSDDGGAEISLLLPAAKESHEGRAILGYHGYWSADTTQSYLLQNWEWHAGRWTEWDKVFNQHGYYPQYYLGECGICYSYPASHGAQFVSTKGWKSCGNFQNYINQIEDFNELIDDWNYFNQGRCWGSTIFIYGHDGWKDFDFEPGDLALLREAMKAYV